MWTTESLWFEIAIVSIVFAVGNIFFGHFEEHTPKIRRRGKYVLVLTLIVGVSILFSRIASMIILGISFLPVIYIHTFILPKNGINGWTAEPKEKYYEFRGWDNAKLFSKEKTDL